MNLKSFIKKINKWVFRIPKFFKKLSKKILRTTDNFGEQHEKKIVMRLSHRRIPGLKQIRYGWEIFSNKEKKLVRKFFGAWVIVVIIFFGIFVFNRTDVYPTLGGTYIEGLLQPPQFLNPVLAFNNDTDVNLNRLIFSGLLKLDENLEIIPDLAEKYVVSDDKKSFTITLRDDLYWHDEQELTIDDVMFTYQTIQNAQFNSPHYGKFQGVEIKKLDDKTIQFNLEKPYAPFLQNLTIGILPRHIWQTIPPVNSKLAEANIKPIGSGPYMFKKLLKDKNGTLISYTFESYKNHHFDRPYIELLQFKFYPNLASAIDSLQKQNVDGIEFISKDSKDNLKLVKGLNFHTFSLPQYTAIFFNTNKNEQLKNLNVRKALALAIDKNDIVSTTLGNEAQIIHGPILPNSIGYHEEITKFEMDKDKSKELLEKEGWKIPEESEDQFRKKDETTLEITLTTVDVPDNINVAEKIRNCWQEVGLKVNLEIVPKKIIEQDIISPRNYQALLFGEILGADPDPFPFWHSSKRQTPGVNLTAFGDKRADSLLEKGRVTTNNDERTEIYKEFQDILIADLPAIFLYSPTYTYPVSEKINGITQTNITSPADRFNGINDWYIKTKRRLIKK